MMSHRLRRAGWPVCYVVLACVPLGIALLPPRAGARPFWIELSLALGFVAIGQLGLEFALIGRFQSISRPYGIDLVMQYHRQIGMVAAAIVLAHPVLLALARPAFVPMLNPLAGPVAARAGALSLYAVLALVLLTVGRRRLRIGYEAWRLTHALLAVAALALAYAHVALMGPYIGNPTKRLALGLYCAVFAALIVHLRVVKPALLRRRPFGVAGVRPEAARTWVLAVEPRGHGGLRFAPGQFAWIKIDVSPWSLREHPFSFCSSAEDPRRLEFGIKELGDFTSTIGRIPAGAPVYVDGPHGSFSTDFLRSDGFLFIAGGIGISPILSMLRTLADRGDRRPHVLIYACSRWDRAAFRDEVRALGGRLDLEVVFVLEHGHEGWDGETGYVSRALLRRILARDAVRRDVLLCGPDPMLAAVESGLLECGVPPERIHMERFDLA